MPAKITIFFFWCNLRISIYYYHQTGDIDDQYTLKLPLTNDDLQFNQIVCDRTNSVLATLTTQNAALPSSQTNDITFLQASSGLMTRIDFPTIGGLTEFQNSGVVYKAELIMHPTLNSMEIIEPPDTIVLYDSDKTNRMISSVQSGILSIEQEFNENTQYSFDITSFIRYELSDNYYDTEHGLLTGFNNNDFWTTLKRVKFSASNQEYKPQLRIYLLLY